MRIGYLRNGKTPTKLSKLLAMSCKSRGIDVIYLTPQDVNDVNKETNTVNGKVFINNEWVPLTSPLPFFIDISPYCYKYLDKDVINYLKEKIILSDNREGVIDKNSLQSKIESDIDLGKFSIPILNINTFEDVLTQINEYKCINFKPVKKENTLMEYIITKNDGEYILCYKDIQKRLTLGSLREFYRTSLEGNNYIVQKYINTRTKTGECFICRINVEKGLKGKWEIAHNYVMVEINKHNSLSNNKGIADSKQFLKANFKEMWREINENLIFLGNTLPYKYEEWRGEKLLTLGIDVLIDNECKCYVLNINTAPTTKPLLAQAAVLRMQYYEYILQNKKM